MTEFNFQAEVVYWRGPAPFYFAVLPTVIAQQIAAQSRSLSYGWGVIPVSASIEGIAFTTSLCPRDGSYLLPLKVSVRRQLAGADLTVVQVALSLRQSATRDGAGPT